jgi:site-specific recombinase XerD
MPNELVRVGQRSVQVASGNAILPVLVERAGGAARFAWEEFFFAEHHNPHTQRAHESAVRRFLSWCEEESVELASISPGMVGKYLVGLGGSAAKRNQHLSALRGFFDRMVQRHVVLLNPAASVSGVKETVVEGKTPEITIDQARKLIASVGTTYTVKTKGQVSQEVVSVVGLRDLAILATLAYTACRAGAIAKLRLQDFQHDGEQHVLRFQEKGGKSREIPVRLELQRDILGYFGRGGHRGRCQGSAAVSFDGAEDEATHGKRSDQQGDLRNGQPAAQSREAAGAAVTAFISRDGDHGSAHPARTARGCSVPGRAQQPANNGALRSAAKKGYPEHRREDFDLVR